MGWDPLLNNYGPLGCALGILPQNSQEIKQKIELLMSVNSEKSSSSERAVVLKLPNAVPFNTIPYVVVTPTINERASNILVQIIIYLLNTELLVNPEPY
ncbi:hypothetical protein STEG23_031342 [Scotinomys teguina]